MSAFPTSRPIYSPSIQFPPNLQLIHPVTTMPPLSQQLRRLCSTGAYSYPSTAPFRHCSRTAAASTTVSPSNPVPCAITRRSLTALHTPWLARDSKRRRRLPFLGVDSDSIVYGLAAVAAALLGSIMERQPAEEQSIAQCQAAVPTVAIEHPEQVVLGVISLEDLTVEEQLRATARSYLTGILLARISNGDIRPQAQLDEVTSSALRPDGDEDVDQLPEHLYDVDKVLSRTPLLRENNAFHDTLNGYNTISCPFVLNKPGEEGGDGAGIEAVVRFGKATAGHPKIVHGGITALTFDNLLGWALFLQGTGPVFTAYLKVDYKALLPCLTTAIVDVTIDRVEGRKLFVTARLRSFDRDVHYASAEALFIKPKPAAENA